MFVTTPLSMLRAGPPPLDDLQQLRIERECERLALRYTHYVDSGAAEKVVDLFTEDGVWEVGSTRLAGEEALRRFFAARQAMKARASLHVVTNHLVEVIDADHARGTSYLVHFVDDDDRGAEPRAMEQQPVRVGLYQDEYERTTNGWRIKRRRVVTTFERSDAASIEKVFDNGK
ncbi:MAG: nuclear transport factor 2 family protein [Steroidobacteraceae bacterium]